MRARAASLTTVALMVIAAATGCKLGGPENNSDKTPAHSVIDTKFATWTGPELGNVDALVLHWTADTGKYGSSDDDYVQHLQKYFEGQPTTFDSSLRSTDKHPVNGHLGSQFVVSYGGTAYQLTRKPSIVAHHATCGNKWAIGIEIAGSNKASGHYIGNNTRQFNGVVALVKELMARYDIPAVNVVGRGSLSGRGVVSHQQVDLKCRWADGVRYEGDGKTDVDPEYLNRVLDEIGAKR